MSHMLVIRGSHILSLQLNHFIIVDAQHFKGSHDRDRKGIMSLQRLFREGMVKVGAFRQNCRQCDEAPMEEAREKICEKCYRENLGKRNNRHFDNDKGPPHESSHCKACSKGITCRDL
uniref:3CxxC-type domain-containing protein n=1 Tax=Esox lucius TaxID=8010 RepID=A0A3P8ZJH2_ESOLU